MKKIILLWVTVFLVMTLDTEIVLAQRQLEKLDHGTLAIKVSSGVYVNWRIPGTEWHGISYNLYRDGTKLNSSPITGASNYLDESGNLNSTYYVRPIVKEIEQAADDTVRVWANSYFDIPVRDLEGNYELNDASVGDLDGDGNYEIIVKRIPFDISLESVFMPLIEAYRMDGTFLWAIDLGPNQINTTQINFAVYDLDGDGRSEVAIKTSEGTIDGTGVKIGDVNGDGITNYRSTATDANIIDGPEFLSVYEGKTGKELVRTDYIGRDPLTQWGEPGLGTYPLAHRASSTMMAIVYIDGKTPSLVICRGIYYRTKMVAFNFRDGSLSELWKFDNAECPPEYRGQGNHNLSVADVDQDGRDEIIYGSMTIDHDGKGLYGTGLGHGDALHVTDINPDRQGLEVWQAHETSTGGTYRDARTGEIMQQYVANRDMGRACAGDITAEYRGLEMWGATECPLYSATGENIGLSPWPVNFMIWWDGDLLREFLDHNWQGNDLGAGIGTISKYDGTQAGVNLLTANGTYTNNYTKGNPCLSADILGDWREEVIWRTTDNKNMRIYTTTIPTDYRIYTLMHDPQYRIAIAWQNNSYNQPPHPGFYLADGMDSVPPPPMTKAKLLWNTGNTWDTGVSANWLINGTSSVFQNGDDVLFDISGANSAPIVINEVLTPSAVTVWSPGDYTFSGTGMLSGKTGLLKSGSGKLTLNNENDFTGYTSIWEGSLVVNGSLLNSTVNVKRFAKIGGKGILGKGLTGENSGELIVGDDGIADTLKVSGFLKELGNVTNHFDLSGDSSGISRKNDILLVDGDLDFSGENIFQINRIEDSLQAGNYTLIKYSGSFSGKTSDIKIKGIPGVPYILMDSLHSIILKIRGVRSPAQLTWKGFENNIWNLAKNMNWLNAGFPDWFVANDEVLFDNSGAYRSDIELVGTLPVNKIHVNAGINYSFNGTGTIGGSGSLVKEGEGKLIINNVNDYTGATVINQGTLEIRELKNGGYPSAVGASGSSPENLVIDGGTLSISGSETTTDRGITMGPSGGTLSITNQSIGTRFNGQITGFGKLIKEGYGLLTLGSSNNYSGGTNISKGTIKLGTEEATIHGLGSGPVTISNATLSMLDNRSSYTDNCDWDIIVPPSANAYLNLDSRCSLTGTLTGSGTLNLYIPYIRSELLGDWSGFEGKIDATAYRDGGTFIVGNTKGFPKASLMLRDNVTAIFRKTSNVTIEIGELSGTSLSKLGAGGEGNSTITWRIGGKNTNAVFAGIICNEQFKNSGAKAAIIKTGSGTWKLTNDNTYTGNTVIEDGTLLVNNLTGSGTGTGQLTVNAGATLGGTGSVSGTVTILPSAVLSPGDNNIGTFTVNNSLTFSASSYLAFDLNSGNKTSDLLKVKGNLKLDGYLYITNYGPGDFKPGDSFKIFDAALCSGQFQDIIPSSPGKGLKWDTTELASTGYLNIALETDVLQLSSDPGIRVFPNPVNDSLHIEFGKLYNTIEFQIESLDGKKIKMAGLKSESRTTIDVSNLKSGTYILKIKLDGNSFTWMIIKI